MIQKLPVFKEPKNKNQLIWRYLDFSKFIDILMNQKLFFCRADLFSDEFEGSTPINVINERDTKFKKVINEYNPEIIRNFLMEEKNNFAINCWHMNDSESKAMWELYLKSNEGIAIQSTYEKLTKCLEKSELIFNIGTVEYIDYTKNKPSNWNDGLSPYVHKRKNYEHEKELRALLWKPYNEISNLNIDLSDGGITIPINVEYLIENIYISPNSPKWFVELIIKTLKKLDYNLPIMNSISNDKPTF
ncbi:hypothetical protein [Algibacter lectus]|uniref:DUF2971 domain-containing protein n=1 Tax=Algibacter lectus TaxID=221126 RepID=A0A090VIU1_9FLAO|nr:hypothetical protein [Algibacter lectus]GAL63269.1 hypothetical protein JCM19300_1291 [Algibacter lectus]